MDDSDPIAEFRQCLYLFSSKTPLCRHYAGPLGTPLSPGPLLCLAGYFDSWLSFPVSYFPFSASCWVNPPNQLPLSSVTKG